MQFFHGILKNDVNCIIMFQEANTSGVTADSCLTMLEQVAQQHLKMLEQVAQQHLKMLEQVA